MKQFLNTKIVIQATVSILIGLVFNAVIYNISFVNNTIRYIWIFIFYLLFFLIIFKKNQSLVFSVLIVALLPIIIDSSVLITNPKLVPLRFPYASSFTILGCIGGYLFTKKKRLISYYLLFVIMYFVIGHYVIIPQILFKILHRDNGEASKFNGIINEKFIGIDKRKVKLRDTLNKKFTLIDFYFVGCRPCEEKMALLKKIRKIYKKDELSIIMICNGAISSWDVYLENLLKNDTNNIVYLFDKDTILFKYKINSYPTELILKNTDMIFHEIGFTKESERLYFKIKKELLKDLQYESN